MDFQDLAETSKGDRCSEHSPPLQAGQVARVPSTQGRSSSSVLPVDDTFRNIQADAHQTQFFPAAFPLVQAERSVSWNENSPSVKFDTRNLPQQSVARWKGFPSFPSSNCVRKLRVSCDTPALNSSEPSPAPGKRNEARADIQDEVATGMTETQRPPDYDQTHDPFMPVNGEGSAGIAEEFTPRGTDKAPSPSTTTSGVCGSASAFSCPQFSIAAGSACCTFSPFKPLGTSTSIRFAKCISNASTSCTLSGETSQRNRRDSAPHSLLDLGKNFCGGSLQSACDACRSAGFRPLLRRTSTAQTKSAPLPEVPARASSFPDPRRDATEHVSTAVGCRLSSSSSTTAAMSNLLSSDSLSQMPHTSCREVSGSDNESSSCEQGFMKGGQKDIVTLCRSRQQRGDAFRGSVISTVQWNISADSPETLVCRGRQTETEASSIRPAAPGVSLVASRQSDKGFTTSQQRIRHVSVTKSPKLMENNRFSASPQQMFVRHLPCQSVPSILRLDSGAPRQQENALGEQNASPLGISETPPQSPCIRRSCSAKAHTTHRVGFSRCERCVVGSEAQREQAFSYKAHPYCHYKKPCRENSKRTECVNSQETIQRQTGAPWPNLGVPGYSTSGVAADDTSRSLSQVAPDSWCVWKLNARTTGTNVHGNSKTFAVHEEPDPHQCGTGYKQLPITGEELVRKHSDWLTEFEKTEALEFREVWYWGRSRKAPAGDSVKAKDCHNNGFDDSRGDYLASLGDHVNYRFEMIAALGRGSFGQVFRAFDHKTGGCVALKIVRNKKHFHVQGCVEVRTLQKLLQNDKDDKGNVIHMKEHFIFRNHLIITFELLNMNLYEFLKRNTFKGLSSLAIRSIGIQLLQALRLLKRQQIVHCDLKPENIVLKNQLKSSIKVIDFGSSCPEGEMPYSYIQSRFYRSPEVLLGLSYGCPIDIWSLGCILAELQTGHPLFAGENETDQTDDVHFVDFIRECLQWDPFQRITPEQALQHEWIKQFKTLRQQKQRESGEYQRCN
ncbi:putative cell-cycle-associated protein kinase DYRK2 [Toxoplasma gondii GAB2-2007-GAL-DOM2]|uniref:Putative cell-cycle-associated protein kinase DYRK2 n=6 Tax=Toxoplasma gondii TaxID=5811 RepID=S7UNN5_TOXGG|nr:putative cell-cycle-associated protein kinase DYRK2 [Toxoplasma gondii GT1]KAF4643980.1 putative cell-cycle-associated protein kinase DYRK2 [Toxoplasma gondii]KFG30098.1 putative cell-cycle-associated protein kinase DYRK2 [Toxoplasma gondii GAB2-2007-GAL-DOM2]KFG33514.1 putative cell-cycle-associated protein kinase DYRK2 [Toxoplasma gondii FOU]PUA87882.1 putative cell-cycle-associated protein kinase DYRK2 [Toxoplasma gondii TgCATBr9]RQX67063.1 putative cell-cycle-associated protein kinase D